MNSKEIIFVLIGVVIIIFGYYTFISPQGSPASEDRQPLNSTFAIEQIKSLGNITKIEAVTGTLVEMDKENLMLRTGESILTIKKSSVTEYFEHSNEISTNIRDNELKQNDEATIVVAVDGSTDEMIALSVVVTR